jgi:hypothetical protein
VPKILRQRSQLKLRQSASENNLKQTSVGNTVNTVQTSTKTQSHSAELLHQSEIEVDDDIGDADWNPESHRIEWRAQQEARVNELKAKYAGKLECKACKVYVSLGRQNPGECLHGGKRNQIVSAPI